MGRLESGGLVGECRFLLALFCAMVRHGETETSGRSDGVLVVEPGGIFVAVKLCAFLRAGFGFHFCLRLHVDTLHSKFDHSSPA